MGVRGEKKCSCAMQERDEGQRDGSLLIELTTKLSGEMPFQEFKRRHAFFAVEGDAPIFGDEAEVIGMGRKKVENAAAHLRGPARGLDNPEDIQAGAAGGEG